MSDPLDLGALDATDRLTEALNILIERSRYVRADMHYELDVRDYRALEEALRRARRSSLVAARPCPRYDYTVYGEPCQTCGKSAEAHVTEPSLRERVVVMMQKRGWSLSWIHRSAYLHLEAAELAEAVRGKHGDPLEESGDVLITLLALSPHDLPAIVAAAERKLTTLETKPPYAGEQRATEHD